MSEQPVDPPTTLHQSDAVLEKLNTILQQQNDMLRWIQTMQTKLDSLERVQTDTVSKISSGGSHEGNKRKGRYEPDERS
jgi:hypothetical protein